MPLSAHNAPQCLCRRMCAAGTSQRPLRPFVPTAAAIHILTFLTVTSILFLKTTTPQQF
jgi:hypothetical protein